MIIFENVCEINYHKHEHTCVFMLIYLDIYITILNSKSINDQSKQHRMAKNSNGEVSRKQYIKLAYMETSTYYIFKNIISTFPSIHLVSHMQGVVGRERRTTMSHRQTDRQTLRKSIYRYMCEMLERTVVITTIDIGRHSFNIVHLQYDNKTVLIKAIKDEEERHFKLSFDLTALFSLNLL